MRRRLAIIAVALCGLTAVPLAAQGLPAGPTSGDGYWACVGTYHIDFGFCVKNPLPERLPVPAVPAVPGR